MYIVFLWASHEFAYFVMISNHNYYGAPSQPATIEQHPTRSKGHTANQILQ